MEYILFPHSIMAEGNLFCIYGTIAAGKTSLAEAFEAEYGATLVREVFSENPYLEDFYQPGGMQRWGFQTEVAFLSRRYDQMIEIAERLKAGEDIVTDWTFEQALVYSSTTLDPRDFATYREIHQRMAPALPKPKVAIRLWATTDELLRRIGQRARPMEQGITREYLQSLEQGYDLYMRDTPYPNLTIDTSSLDIPGSAVDRFKALSQVWDHIQECRIPAPEVREQVKRHLYPR